LDKNKIKHYEDLLLGEKKDREAALFGEELGKHVSLRDATHELSSYDNHPGDMGTETFEAEKNFSFRTNDKFMISEINVALDKIHNGTYGECERCHKPIDGDRLEIVPHARFCIDCENEIELSPLNEDFGRPIEEMVQLPTLQFSFRDDTIFNETGYDGEDTWQDLNEYNVKMNDNNFDHEDSFGYVEDVDQVTNAAYKKQLE
jgi:YteA family regulatory protein